MNEATVHKQTYASDERVAMPRLACKECQKVLLFTILLGFIILFYYQSVYTQRHRNYDILESIGTIRKVMYEIGKSKTKNESKDIRTVKPNQESETFKAITSQDGINMSISSKSEIPVNGLARFMVQCMEELRKMNSSRIGTGGRLPSSCRMAVKKEKPRVKPLCSKKDQSTVGPLYVDRSPVTFEALYKESLSFVQEGGRWSPENCTSKTKTAIIIPYRDRQEHLGILLRQLLPILQRQMLSFQVFVIEQGDQDIFNRGKLMNVGFAEALSKDEFTCFVFHDVDLIPEDDRIDYGCHASPQHLSVAVDKFNYKLPYKEIFGGVEMFATTHFQEINGFSNSFWGWGAEDDNLYHRLIKSRMTLWRQSPAVAKYVMLRHGDNEAKASNKRFDILQRSKEYVSTDGLNSLQYKVMTTKSFQLYTLITVDLVKGEDRLFGVLEKITDVQ